LQEESVRSTRSALALTLVGALALVACGGDDETEATVAVVSPTHRAECFEAEAAR
jgi:predicted outer membrane protein